MCGTHHPLAPRHLHFAHCSAEVVDNRALELTDAYKHAVAGCDLQNQHEGATRKGGADAHGAQEYPARQKSLVELEVGLKVTGTRPWREDGEAVW